MISKFSVKKPYTVLVGVVLVIVLGIVSFTKMTADLLPSISLPYVIVMTTYAGASPETVEMVVTKPVEASMATVSNIENISSVSGENYSIVVLEFAQSSNMDSISLEIREKLDQISGYWKDDLIGNPMIMKLNPDMLPVMIAAAGVEGMTVAEVGTFVQEEIMPELESIEGVASVNATGLIEESINVLIRQEKIDAINQQINASIDEKMEDARQELIDGKAEIQDGLDKLADGQKELNKGQKELDDNKNKLEDGKQELLDKQNETIQQLAEAKTMLLTAKSDLEALKISLTMNIGIMEQLMGVLDNLMNQEMSPELEAMIKELEDYLAENANLPEYDPALVKNYINTMREQLNTCNKNIVTVDENLTELEKGELSAVLGFADGMTQITLGETQLIAAQAQIDAAKKELESTEKQLQDALEQFADGEEQLEDARKDAQDKANMKEVLNVDMVSALLTAQNFSMPAGYVTEDGVSYMVRVGDKPDTIEEMSKIPLLNLHMEGVDIITLADVADVFFVDNEDEIYANVNGNPGVMLTIQKQTGYSTGEVSDLLAERFDELMTSKPGLQMIKLMDQGIYIDLVMDSIINNVVYGALLAILILILFLKDLRPTMVVAFSIPISLVTAVVCMYFSGITLNVISLSGLALGVGMLVDNSIVVIENIYRMRSEGKPLQEAAVEGAKEVAGAIMASTLTTVCVFLPIVFTEGMTRQLFVDMGLTIAYSLLASLLIALTVVPAMASKMLNRTKEQKDGKLFGRFVKGYEWILGGLKVKPLVLLLVVVLFGVSAVAAYSNGTAFMSDMDSTQLTVNVQLEEGATLADTKTVADEVVRRLQEIEEIQDIGAMSSGSTMSMLTGESGSSDSVTIYVTTIEEKTLRNEEIAAIIKGKTADIEAEITVDTSSMDMSALGGSGITIQLEGRDLDTLRGIATDVAQLLSEVEGTKDVSDGMEDAKEELRITVNKDAAMEYGLTVAQVFTQVSGKLSEKAAATTLAASNKDYGVYVFSAADESLTRKLLQEMYIKGTDADGEVNVPFSEIADFEMVQSLNAINRAHQTRYIAVSAAIADGYNVGLVAKDVEEKLAGYAMPDGYKMVFSGENETINDALGQVSLMLVLALVFMYLIMVAQFQSLLSPFIIMFTIPLAFTGGLLGLYFTGSELSVIAMIGFVMLSGIIVNNGIVLIDYMNQLRAEGRSKKEAIIEAGRTRLRPVLMTTLTTILALSTMVFSKDMGAEMMRPMAIVTIGGLLYGTLLTLIVIPCVYDWFIREKRVKPVKKDKPAKRVRNMIKRKMEERAQLEDFEAPEKEEKVKPVRKEKTEKSEREQRPEKQEKPEKRQKPVVHKEQEDSGSKR